MDEGGERIDSDVRDESTFDEDEVDNGNDDDHIENVEMMMVIVFMRMMIRKKM